MVAPPAPASPLAESPDQPTASAPPEPTTSSNEGTAPTHRDLAADTAQVTHKESPTTSAIIATARAQVRQMASRQMTEAKPEKNRIESAMERAFKPRKEPPGVTMLADGTIRVVTDWGKVYCVRATEEAGIPGPEDDMPLNMTCN